MYTWKVSFIKRYKPLAQAPDLGFFMPAFWSIKTDQIAQMIWSVLVIALQDLIITLEALEQFQ